MRGSRTLDGTPQGPEAMLLHGLFPESAEMFKLSPTQSSSPLLSPSWYTRVTPFLE